MLFRFILSLSTGQEMILNFSKFKVLEKLDMSHTTIFNDSHLGVIGANCQQLSLLMINGKNWIFLYKKMALTKKTEKINTE